MGSSPFKTIDSCYVVLAEFSGSVAIWRGGVFDSAYAARDSWDDFRGEFPDLDVQLLQVIPLAVRADGTVHTIGGGCAL